MDIRGSDKNKRIFCPFLGLSKEEKWQECMKEHCALWDVKTERCSIKVIAQNLYKETA